jgi:hypothetical protein
MTIFPPGKDFAMSPLARVLLALVLAVGELLAATADPLPRFTEEREAAALHFVRKHCPELVPLLEDLKKTNRAAYELQIRETFQITELLADLQSDQKRYELELQIWKTENKALVLVAQLATPKEEARKDIEEQLLRLACELTEYEAQALEHRAALLQTELALTKDEIARYRDNFDRIAKERFESLLEKARKRKP